MLADKLSRLGQTIQAEWSLLLEVFQSISQIDLLAKRFNNKLTQFVSPVHLGQSGLKVIGLPMQENHSDCSRVAQHALVLGSSGNVKPDPIVPG